MNLLDTLFKEHRDLLQSRGYDEVSLESPFKKGGLLEDLKRQLRVAFVAMAIDDTTTGFTLTAVGCFNKNENAVRYELHYRFDPVNSTLDLYQLDVRWDNYQSKFKLNTSYELLPAKAALLRLKKENGLIKRAFFKKDSKNNRPGSQRM